MSFLINLVAIDSLNGSLAVLSPMETRMWRGSPPGTTSTITGWSFIDLDHLAPEFDVVLI